jgi:flavin-dependent dehydrogenase
MAQSECFDALVVGGGPAGALTALHLARCGWRVAVLEKGRRHRGKSCGHCLGPAARRHLGAAGLWRSTVALAGARTERLRLHHWSARPIDAPLARPRDREPGLVIAREVLDQHLLDAARRAGATVLQPASAGPPEYSAGSVRLVAQLRGGPRMLMGRMIVGADGLRSSIASSLAPRRRVGPASAVRCYGFSFDLDDVPGSPGPATIEMFLAPYGYLGAVAHARGVHVAALVRQAPDGHRRDPVNFVRRLAQLHPRSLLHDVGLERVERRRLDNFQAAGPMPWRPRHVAGAWGALVGDAAGYVEPFTGEGMSWALHSAALLSRVCGAADPGSWSSDLARRYRVLHRRHVSRRQRLCFWLRQGLRRPCVCGAAFRVAARSPRLVQRLVDAIVT